jgi:hypothetical protein
MDTKLTNLILYILILLFAYLIIMNCNLTCNLGFMEGYNNKNIENFEKMSQTREVYDF